MIIQCFCRDKVSAYLYFDWRLLLFFTILGKRLPRGIIIYCEKGFIVMAYFINTLVYADRHSRGEQQINFLGDIKNLKADGVEARLEYFSDFEQEAPLFAKKAKGLNLKINLSVPDELFVAGELNPKLSTYFKFGKVLQIDEIKFNTGDFGNFTGKLSEITNLLPSGMSLNVENDQTELSGNSENILKFLMEAQKNGLDVGYVYDLGNWLVTNEDPIKVAEKLAPFTRYIHLKNMTGHENETSTTLDQGKLDWQAPAKFFHAGTDVALEYPIVDFDTRESELKMVKTIYR